MGASEKMRGLITNNEDLFFGLHLFLVEEIKFIASHCLNPALSTRKSKYEAKFILHSITVEQ